MKLFGMLAVAVGAVLLGWGVGAQDQGTNQTHESQPAKVEAPAPAGTVAIRILNAGDMDLGFWFTLLKLGESNVEAAWRLGRTLESTEGETSFDKDSVVMQRVDPRETIELFLPMGEQAVFVAATYSRGRLNSENGVAAGLLAAPRKWVFWRGTGNWRVKAWTKAEEDAFTAEKNAGLETAPNEKDDAAARLLKHHQELAEKGDAYGQYRMGKRYLTGDGVQKDIAKAREMFQKAAAQDHSQAATDAAAELRKMNRAKPVPSPQP